MLEICQLQVSSGLTQVSWKHSQGRLVSDMHSLLVPPHPPHCWQCGRGIWLSWVVVFGDCWFAVGGNSGVLEVLLEPAQDPEKSKSTMSNMHAKSHELHSCSTHANPKHAIDDADGGVEAAWQFKMCHCKTSSWHPGRLSRQVVAGSFCSSTSEWHSLVQQAC